MLVRNPRLKIKGAYAALAVVGLAYGAGSHAQDDGEDVVVIDDSIWSLVTSGESLPWPEADEFCATLEVGGFDDWRLPQLVELEALHDPEAEQSIRGPFDLEDCCAWSSMDLTDLEPEAKGNLPPPGGPPGNYYWGFLFDGGISYYSNGMFPDGFAMCTREADAG